MNMFISFIIVFLLFTYQMLLFKEYVVDHFFCHINAYSMAIKVTISDSFLQRPREK